ncbi:MAG: hypothetical protein ACRDSZ_13810 [Pseudonocardiaceae bacterium]
MPYGELAEAGSAVRGQPQVEVFGGFVVADLQACPVFVCRMGECLGECGLVGQIIGVELEDDIVGESHVAFAQFRGAAHGNGSGSTVGVAVVSVVTAFTVVG